MKFLKNWTLPVAMGTGAVVYLIFYLLPQLDNLGNQLSPVMDAILPLFMFLVLYVTFCKVNFRRLIPVHWHLWVGVFQVLFVFLIVGAIIAFHIQGKNLILLEAILTCIIGPCASAAAVVTQKLGGNLEEMTTYTFLTNFGCALLVPLCFPLIVEDKSGMTFLQAFVIILEKSSVVLVLPMVLAYITKHFPPMRRLHQWVTGVKDLSYYLWGCSLLIVTGTTVKNIVHAETTVAFLLVIAGLGLLLCIIQFAVGRYIGHFFNSTIDAGQALGQKNTVFAIWMAYTYLNPLSSVGPGCYILWQNIINSIEIWQKRREELRCAA